LAEEKGNPKGITRREFITGAGAIVVVGTVAGLAACVGPTTTETKTPTLAPTSTGKEIPTPSPTEGERPIPVPGMAVVHDATVCAGCGVCGLMCSLYHESESGPALSRSELVRDPFAGTCTFNVCQQCRSPSCYFACPSRDQALCVDEATGVKYINEDKCDGCRKCIQACPFDPPRIKLNTEKNIAQNCNLCRDREEGPVCVQYCGPGALSYTPGSAR
jgi:Fe-S-cluster-containing dehydrogenase component